MAASLRPAWEALLSICTYNKPCRIFHILLMIFFFWDRVSLLSLSCLTTHLIDHAGLRFTELCLPLSPSTRRGMYYHTQLIHIFCISSIILCCALACKHLKLQGFKSTFCLQFWIDIFSLFWDCVMVSAMEISMKVSCTCFMFRFQSKQWLRFNQNTLSNIQFTLER